MDGSKLYGEHGEGFGTNTRRAVNGLVGTRGSLRGLVARAVCANVDTGGGSSTIDLLKFVDHRSSQVRRPSIFSSSSMKGNVRENSTGVRKEVHGDEDVEDKAHREKGGEKSVRRWLARRRKKGLKTEKQLRFDDAFPRRARVA
jgi:hypothetical protein